METVLVTGATGFIGTRLIKELILQEDVAEVLALYRSEIPFLHEKVYWIKGDLDHLPRLAKGKQPTKVIHCAALQNRGASQKRIFKDNIRWTENIINFSENNNIDEILFFSSINVRLMHCGAYAQSKKVCERMLRESGLKYKIVRPALVFGEGENGITSLINYIQHLPIIPVFGNGCAKEQPIYVEDLAKLTVRYLLDQNAPLIVEFCGESAMEYDIMVRKLAGIMDKKVRIFHLPFLPFYYGLRVLEKLNLVLPISAEQVAHIAENLECEMCGICERYQISLTSFEEGMAYIQHRF